MCNGIIHFIINFSDRTREAATRTVASACTLRVVTVVTVTRLAWLDSARVAAVVVVARLTRCAVEVEARLARCTRSGRCSWRLAIIYLFVTHPNY